VEAKTISSSTLKLIAILAMALDHIGNVFWPQLSPLARILLITPGGLTFPIMAYLLTEGYRHTRNVKFYALRLLIFAAASLVPFIWTLPPQLNIFFTLFFGLIAIYLYDHMQNRMSFWIAFASLTFLNFFSDWGPIGVPMILCYHVIKNPLKRIVLPLVFPWLFIALSVFFRELSEPGYLAAALPDLLYAAIGCTAAIPLLRFYNNKRGRPLKYAFYAFYPVHLILLGLLRGLIFGIWR
jgi:hypothetical protein